MTTIFNYPYNSEDKAVFPVQAPADRFREHWWVPYLLFGVDLLAVGVVVMLLHPDYFLPVSREALRSAPYFHIGLALAVLSLPVGYRLAGLVPGYGLGPVERIRRFVKTTFGVSAALLFWDMLLQEGAWFHADLFPLLVGVAALCPVATFLVSRALLWLGCWGRPVAILGASDSGLRIMEALRAQPALGYVPVGFLEDRADRENGRIVPIPLLGTISEARQLCPDVKTAIIALPKVGVGRLNHIVMGLPFPDVIVVPDLLGFQTLWVSAKDIGGVLGLQVKRNLLLRHNRIIKRLLDIVTGSVMFLLSLPVLLVCGMCIKLVDPGPMFFRHEREGANGRRFRMLKLRTMYHDAEQKLEAHLSANQEARAEWDRCVKLQKDPRILPGIGRLIRKLSLDELPQLWHVVCGEMSMVGPRPFPTYHISRFDRDFQELRAGVIPGLTGLWQVDARGGDLKAQQALDTYYIRNWSPWLDLYIFARTFKAVFNSDGAH